MGQKRRDSARFEIATLDFPRSNQAEETQENAAMGLLATKAGAS
jgi:hypothetical protein